MKIVKGQPFPLGVEKKENAVNFSVAVPAGQDVHLLLYKEDSIQPEEKVAMDIAIGDVRCISLEEMDRLFHSYNYEVDGEVFIDPYVKDLYGKSVWGEKKEKSRHEIRGKIYAEDYDWGDDRCLELPYEDVIAYSLHVRGFTRDPHSGVQEKGTFEGIMEKIPYLKELGINQIQCMPVYEFEECTEPVNYWGYGPAYYFAPKNAYSAQGNGSKSLKDLVKALHKAGIEIVLEMPFDESVPKQLIVDCLRYYVMEYHIDGFVCNHFIAPMDVLYSDPYLKNAKIMKHHTEFKDTMRRFLKGDAGEVYPFIYWLHHLSGKDGIFNYVTSHSGFTLNDLVSYNEKHNVLNGENNRDGSDYNDSWNCGTEGPTQYNEIVALRKNQVRNAFALMILSQGTPCILAGDEWGNSQLGNNNVYCQDNELGWLNWEKFPYHHDLFEYVKSLIKLRKSYKVFHPSKEFCGKDMKNCGIPDRSYHGEEAWKADFSWDSRRVGVYYHGEMEDIYVAYNMHWEEGIFALPKLPDQKRWYQIASTQNGIFDVKEIIDNQKSQTVIPRTIAVFAGKRSDET